MFFRQFVRECQITDDQAGDFLRDAKLASDLPDAQSWDELLVYLRRGRDVAAGAVEGARKVWDKYRSGRSVS